MTTKLQVEIDRLNKKFNKRLTTGSYLKLLENVEKANKKFYYDGKAITVDEYLEDQTKPKTWWFD